MTFNPHMLTCARESRRLTQKELAVRSETSQAAISKAEAGNAKPTQFLVEAWAKALAYAPTFFNMEPVASPRTLYRKRASLPATDAKAIRSAVQIQTIQLQRLVRSVEILEDKLPRLTIGKDIESASEAARHLRQLWRMPRGPVAKVIAAIENEGVFILQLMVSHEKFDGISLDVRDGDTPPIIFLNHNFDGDRIRRTAVHELGHLVLHHHLPQLPDECEDQADDFANEFLMPAVDITFSNRLTLEELASMKRHWGTSMQSLLFRATELKRVSALAAQKLWKQLAYLGYKRNEPVKIEKESATLVKELFRVHREELDYSDEELATLLMLEVAEVESVYGEREHSKVEKPKLRLV